MDAGPQRYTARLLIGCADQPGIVAAVSGFLLEQGANIVSSHQYSTDPIGGRFFMRTELFLHELSVDTGAPEVRRRFEKLFATEVADRLGMDWEILTGASAGESRSSFRATITASSTCCGAGAEASWTATWLR